jgi:hypothetical protein
VAKSLDQRTDVAEQQNEGHFPDRFRAIPDFATSITFDTAGKIRRPLAAAA